MKIKKRVSFPYFKRRGVRQRQRETDRQRQTDRVREGGEGVDGRYVDRSRN